MNRLFTFLNIKDLQSWNTNILSFCWALCWLNWISYLFLMSWFLIRKVHLEASYSLLGPMLSSKRSVVKEMFSVCTVQHMWLLSTWDVAIGTENLNFVFNFNSISHSGYGYRIGQWGLDGIFPLTSYCF